MEITLEKRKKFLESITNKELVRFIFFTIFFPSWFWIMNVRILDDVQALLTASLFLVIGLLLLIYCRTIAKKNNWEISAHRTIWKPYSAIMVFYTSLFTTIILSIIFSLLYSVVFFSLLFYNQFNEVNIIIATEYLINLVIFFMLSYAIIKIKDQPIFSVLTVNYKTKD